MSVPTNTSVGEPAGCSSRFPPPCITFVSAGVVGIFAFGVAPLLAPNPLGWVRCPRGLSLALLCVVAFCRRSMPGCEGGNHE